MQKKFINPFFYISILKFHNADCHNRILVNKIIYSCHGITDFSEEYLFQVKAIKVMERMIY